MIKRIVLTGMLAALGLHVQAQQQRYNVVFILSDDHRYDAMGFMNKFKGLKTPSMDMMAREGAHIRNAFVATALCSPSRASILTGLYPHAHNVVDNQSPVPSNLRFFPEYLKENGYQTGFFGKWHMGEQGEQKQNGFDTWVSFKGQGAYYNPIISENGVMKQFKDSTYLTDLLTTYAIDFIKNRDKSRPFFAYLSHKGVHYSFQPAKRHRGMYKDLKFQPPPSMYMMPIDSIGSSSIGEGNRPVEDSKHFVNRKDVPMWVRAQRYSWHGVDYMFHGEKDIQSFYTSYLETLMAVDESVGKIIEYLRDNDLLKNTVVFYMGDNGFSFGEHGLIDKRHAYEESMRVPLLVYAPNFIKPSTRVNEIIQNIDIAPTILDIAGADKPAHMQGTSFLKLLQGKQQEWRARAYYEYYWEFDYPQTPTIFSVRTKQFKYIYNYGVWDTNELYDLTADPDEMNNLISNPGYKQLALDLRKEVFDWLEQTGGLQIPLRRLGNQTRIDHKFLGRP